MFDACLRGGLVPESLAPLANSLPLALCDRHRIKGYLA